MVTKYGENGVAELFIQPVAEWADEMAVIEQERQAKALLKLIMMAKDDIAQGRLISGDELLSELQKSQG